MVNYTTKSVKYTISSIYKYNASDFDEMQLQMVPENTMYVTFDSVKLLESSNSSRITTTFFIKNVDDLDKFKEAYFKITGLDSADYNVSLDDSVYKNKIEPLTQLSNIIDITKIVIIVTHDVNVVKEYGKRYLLENGKLSLQE